MHANKSFNQNLANHRSYHDLIEALIEDENALDKGVVDTVQDHKRKHVDDEDDDDEDPPARPNQGKQTKRKRTKDSESSKKPSTTKETPKDDASDDVVYDDDQPQDASEPKTTKTPNPDWFKQPPRPPTLDPEWNKRQVVLDQPEQPWFNQIVFDTKDPLTFNDLMATLIDFSKGDFVDLHMNNIEDMLLLAVEQKLFHLTDNNIVDFIVALRMFTRSLVIKKRVDDLQLGVKRVIYEDLTKQKRVMRADELYKFSDGTLKKVQDELHHRIRDFHLKYNTEMPRRKWTAIEKKVRTYGRVD
uniref:Uncharacterized protein n=1 Tax=Tanacetum cinerariifolium TaxID=118510 RepID=A0A699JSI8_TANCI|nr:hypothetical protein [Tanacetum cinerariifolium]